MDEQQEPPNREPLRLVARMTPEEFFEMRREFERARRIWRFF